MKLKLKVLHLHGCIFSGFAIRIQIIRLFCVRVKGVLSELSVACNAVKSGHLSILTCLEYGVPWGTLHRKLHASGVELPKGKSGPKFKHGNAETVFNAAKAVVEDCVDFKAACISF